MDLGEAMITRLLDQSSVTDIVDDRVFWTRRDQGGTLPALILQSAGGEGEDLDLEDEADSTERRIQCSALASTHEEASALADAASAALIGDYEVDDFLFWLGSREEPIDLGSDSTAGGFIHEVARDVVLRISRN